MEQVIDMELSFSPKLELILLTFVATGLITISIALNQFVAAALMASHQLIISYVVRVLRLSVTCHYFLAMYLKLFILILLLLLMIILLLYCSVEVIYIIHGFPV